MKNINKLKTCTRIEKSWTVNKSIYKATSKEPQSTLDDTKHLIQILVTKNEKADFGAIVEYDCKHLSVPDQSLLLELLQDVEELIDGTLGDWDCELVPLQLK